MEIAEMGALLVPAASAAAVLMQNMGNRRRIIKRLDEVEKQQLVLIMHDAFRPWSVRLDAGKKYIDLGGNGSEEAYYEKIKQRYKDRVERKMLEEETL